MFIKLVDEKNYKGRKIVYYVAMILSIAEIILSFFAPMCVLDVDGEAFEINALNWIWIDKNNPNISSFLFAQILSFSIAHEKNEDKINKNSDVVSNVSFIVISLYLIFTWFSLY